MTIYSNTFNIKIILLKSLLSKELKDEIGKNTS